MSTDGKLVLDACCGGRMFWFDKKNPLAFYIDARREDPGFVKARPNCSVQPDEIMDFRSLKFDDNTFYLTVFDPPHLKHVGDNAYMAKKYGKLSENWREDLRQGFSECWRVTKLNGVIVFKWNEYEIKTSEVLKAIGRDPLFGHTTNSKGTTKWMCFLKTT